MPLRKSYNTDLAPELQKILMKNGMQAHVIGHGGTYQLAVQGHDSPLLTYNLTEQQLRKLCDWGTNSANKSAYNTFTEIVGADFHIPKNYVHARNANGRVVMGLHGYRAEEVRGRVHGFGRDYLGWTPRQQPGFHMRRLGGALFMQGPSMIPERRGGYMKPGELQSGAYGFYYKGGQQTQQVQKQDVLKDLPQIKPVETRPRQVEPAKPYNELVSSKVYFTNEKWQECLSSHGLVINPKEGTLTVQSSAVSQDLVYTLSDAELKKLTSNSIKDVPVNQRLEIINNVIGGDFKDKVTMEMLNSRQQVSIDLKPEIRAELTAQQNRHTEFQSSVEEVKETVYDSNIIDGHNLQELKESKGWYREGAHGREVDVGEIKVEKDREQEGKFRMTAVINGESITHEISQKQYDKFMAVDDYHRMKLFSKVFPEVDMKTIPGQGANLGAAILAGLSVVGGMAGALGRREPDVYVEHHGHDRCFGGHVYMKPGVDSPQEIAARAFEAGVHASEHHGLQMAR